MSGSCILAMTLETAINKCIHYCRCFLQILPATCSVCPSASDVEYLIDSPQIHSTSNAPSSAGNARDFATE